MKRSAVLTVAALAATTLTLGACSSGGSASGNSATGGGGQVLTIGGSVGSQTDNSNPFMPTSSARMLGYGNLIYEPLAMVNTTNPSQAPTPWLATKIAWNADYTQVTFTIRKNVKWSDGKPMTVDDVVYSLQLRKDNPALNADSLPYKDIKAEGDNVVVTFTSSQYVNQTKVARLQIVPKHIWQNIKDPTTDLNQHPVGTGPYTLKSWTAQSVTMVPNPTYWGTKPQVPEIRYTPYNDNNAITTALNKGDIQWTWVFLPNYKKVYVDSDPTNHKVDFPLSLASDVLVLNTQKAPFNDVAVRKAVNMVIDRKSISTRAESGIFPPITSVTGLPEPAGTPYVSAAYKNDTLKVDVAGAKKVLTDAGYTYSGNKLIGKDGKPVKVVLTDPAGWSDYLTSLQIISDSMKRIGIDATIDSPNADTWTSDLATGNFQASLHWTDGGSTPWTTYANIMAGSYYKPIGQTASWNFGRYQNKEADAALNAYATASSDAERQTALNTLEQIWVTDVPAVSSVARPSLGVYNTKYYTGFPTAQDQYAAPDQTQPEAAQIILKLRPVK